MRSGTIVLVEAVATMKSDPTLLKRSVQCMVALRHLLLLVAATQRGFQNLVAYGVRWNEILVNAEAAAAANQMAPQFRLAVRGPTA
jgi:hypothetical protein